MILDGVFKRDDIIGVFGRRGSGKSRLLHKLITNYAPRVGVYDINREYSEVGAVASSRRWVAWHAFKLRYSETARLVYQPEDVDDLAVELDEILLTAMKHLENAVLVVDEIDLLVQKMSPHRSGLYQVVNRGRHRGLGLWYATRRPADVPTTLTANTNHFLIFRQHLPRDLKFFETALGLPMDELAELDKYHALHVNADTGEKGIIEKSEF